MDLLNNISNFLSGAVDMLVEKNRVCAQLNRLRAIISSETDIIDQAYIELGKIYMKKLEGKNDDISTKIIIDTINTAKARLKKAQTRYEYILRYGMPDYNISIDTTNPPVKNTSEQDEPAKAEAEDEEGDITIAYSGDKKGTSDSEDTALNEEKKSADTKKKRTKKKAANTEPADSEAADDEAPIV